MFIDHANRFSVTMDSSFNSEMKLMAIKRKIEFWIRNFEHISRQAPNWPCMLPSILTSGHYMTITRFSIIISINNKNCTCRYKSLCIGTFYKTSDTIEHCILPLVSWTNSLSTICDSNCTRCCWASDSIPASLITWFWYSSISLCS